MPLVWQHSAQAETHHHVHRLLGVKIPGAKQPGNQGKQKQFPLAPA